LGLRRCRPISPQWQANGVGPYTRSLSLFFSFTWQYSYTSHCTFLLYAVLPSFALQIKALGPYHCTLLYSVLRLLLHVLYQHSLILFVRSSLLSLTTQLCSFSHTSFSVFYFTGSQQASVAVLQKWKDGVVTYLSSSQECVEVEKSVLQMCSHLL
jgi:hypothetical protein